jgi:predicted metal-dependent phosphoesterase TrpH
MTTSRWCCAGLLAASVAAGAFSDVPRERPPLFIGGYRVLAADFHVHSHPLSWATLTPWDTVLEAQRQGLDVIAMTGHNHVWVSQVGRWFSRRIGGPAVLVSEEIATLRYHLIATGITTTVSWNQSAAAAIAEIHRQGGVAIAAHPYPEWPGYDDAAVQLLDAAEIVRPEVSADAERGRQLQQFARRRAMTAIGSSDYHGLGSLGASRTYVFARDDSEDAILSALRERRTVVYDRDGRAFGDPELIRLAAQDRRLALPGTGPPQRRALALASRVAGVLGLLGLLLLA